MKKQLLRLLPVAAVLLTASCTDDQYDISNVDTESRFTAKGLVIPLNMSPIMLDNIISVDNNEDDEIKTDGQGNFYFHKKSKEPFQSDDVNVDEITITKPADIEQSVTVTADDKLGTILEKWEQYAPNNTIGEILEMSYIREQMGIDGSTKLFHLDVNELKTNIKLHSEGIDNDIKRIGKLGFKPLDLNIEVDLDDLKDVVNVINITDLKIDLPRGMEMDVANQGSYNQNSGLLSYDAFAISSSNKFLTNMATVNGLDYSLMKGSGEELFDATNHKFNYEKDCGVSGTAKITANDLNSGTTLNNMKAIVNNTLECSCTVKFGDNLVVNMFSGGINHTIEDIHIDPVSINKDDLPEFLQEGANLEIENPQLYLDLTNPFFGNNITATAKLSITGNKTFVQEISLDEERNKKVLSPKNEDLRYPAYKWEQFADLGKILTGDKIPDALTIKVLKPILNANEVKNFELGKNHIGIKGTWEFYTKLSMTENTRIKYTKVWDDWGSKDLNGLTVEKAVVTFNFNKDVVLDAESITFTLLGKTGKLVGTTTDVKGNANEISVTMSDGPIKDIYGGRLVVSLKGEGEGKDINTSQKIEISNLRMKVDGYYDKEF